LTTTRGDARGGFNDEQVAPDRDQLAANVASAKTIGKLAAEAALAKGIKSVVLIVAARVIIRARARARTASRCWCSANWRAWPRLRGRQV